VALLFLKALNPPLLVAGALICGFAAVISLWIRGSYRGYGWLERLEGRRRGFIIALALLAGFYFLVNSWLSVHRYHKLLCGSWDLGIFESLLSNALEGRWFEDYRGPFDHFSPAVYLYLPFYALWREARLLLVLQSAALAAAAWPLYLFAREVTGRAVPAAVCGMVYLLYPLVGQGNLYDFHAVSLSPLFFFSMLALMRRGRWGWYWVFAVLLLSVKEGEAVLLFGAGLYLLSLREWRQGALSAGAAVAWVLLGTLQERLPAIVHAYPLAATALAAIVGGTAAVTLLLMRLAKRDA